MTSTRPKPQVRADRVKNSPDDERVLNAGTILQIIRTAGWPDALITNQTEHFSEKGWLHRLSITLGIAQVESSKVSKQPPVKFTTDRNATVNKSSTGVSFSSIVSELMPPPPKRPPKSISIAIPKTKQCISILIAHLWNLKTSLEYMDNWLKTFSNQSAFKTCSPTLGHRSLFNSNGFYWVHDRCFIQIQNERTGDLNPNTTRALDISQLRRIATGFDVFLGGEHPHPRTSQADPSSSITGSHSPTKDDSSESPQIHTYPKTCTLQSSDHHLTINVPALLRLLLPATERSPIHTRYQLSTLENNILTPDDNICVRGDRPDGIFGFRSNEGKSGKEVIVFIVGNSQRYLTYLVKVEVEVLEKKGETEEERLRREVEEKEWELDLASGGCDMVEV